MTPLYSASCGWPRVGRPPSETFAFEAVRAADPDKLYTIYALYDFDRSGQDASRSLQEKLKRFATDRQVEFFFTCLAIEEADIDLASFDPDEHAVDVHLEGVGWKLLPTRAPKRKSTLVGFTCVRYGSLLINDCPVHQHASGQCWVALPGRPLVEAGRHKTDPITNKPAFAARAEWASRTVGDRFSELVFSLIRERHPAAFQGGSAP